MGVFDFFSIDLAMQLSSGTFFPGNVVKGTVQISVRKPCTVRAIRLRFTGTVKYEFHARHAGHRRGDVNVVDTEFTIVGAPRGGSGELPLPIGQWTYPFVYALPTNAPPSFHTSAESRKQRASVQYSATAYADIPWSPNAEATVPFQVLSCVPQSQFVGAQRPVSVSESAVMTSCFGGVSHVSADLSLDKAMYFIGRDRVSANLHVVNMTKKAIASLRVKLVHDCLLSDGPHQRSVTKDEVSQELPCHIDAHSTADIPISVSIAPTLQPSTCAPHAKSSYFVRVGAGRGKSSTEVSVPVAFVHGVDPSNTLPIITYDCPAIADVPHPMQYTYSAPDGEVPQQQMQMQMRSSLSAPAVGVPLPMPQQGNVYSDRGLEGVPVPLPGQVVDGEEPSLIAHSKPQPEVVKLPV